MSKKEVFWFLLKDYLSLYKGRNSSLLIQFSTTGVLLGIFRNFQNGYSVEYLWTAASLICELYRSANWLENKLLFIFASKFSLSQGSIFLLTCHFYIFNPDLVEYFVKIIRSNRKLDVVLILATFKNQWEMSQLQIQKIKTIIKNRKSFLHGYTQYLRWGNSNHGAVIIDEKYSARSKSSRSLVHQKYFSCVWQVGAK